MYPGNTYDYAPFDKSNADMFYNNLYGKGNCLDRLQDCKSTGNNAVVRNPDTNITWPIHSPPYFYLAYFASEKKKKKIERERKRERSNR